MASPVIGGINHHPCGIIPRLPGAIKEEKTMDSSFSTKSPTTENNQTLENLKNNLLFKKNSSHSQRGRLRWSCPWRPSEAILQSHATLHWQIRTNN
ncbi:unnamed protein product [Linum trigynum]|uniref:Uncharacterized protein n=1 Tax=Linum trigynum TaxID=586398 RepID=A0AAV2DYS0_9ROSI